MPRHSAPRTSWWASSAPNWHFRRRLCVYIHCAMLYHCAEGAVCRARRRGVVTLRNSKIPGFWSGVSIFCDIRGLDVVYKQPSGQPFRKSFVALQQRNRTQACMRETQVRNMLILQRERYHGPIVAVCVHEMFPSWMPSTRCDAVSNTPSATKHTSKHATTSAIMQKPHSVRCIVSIDAVIILQP